MMNMKRVMMIAAMAAILGTGTIPSAYADVSVEDVKCTQRYPWNGLVDIEYTIACDDPEADIYVNPVGFNGDTGLTVFPTHFTGDGATNTVKAGKHTMVWDAKADLGNLFATKNFQIKLYAGKKLSRYIVIDISGGTEAETYPVRHSIEGPNLADDTCRTTEIWMRLIPPGTFMMGSPEDEMGRTDNEDLHKVTLTQPYYMGVFEVTQRQWELVKGNRPSNFILDYETRPVERVSYADVRAYCPDYRPSASAIGPDGFLGILRRKTSMAGFDLPTEAQWEYACRAGTLTSFNDGSSLSGTVGSLSLNTLGRYYLNGYNGGYVSTTSSTNITTTKVGSYRPNALGLYDMHGNVDEWCRDFYKEHLESAHVVDPLCTIDYGYFVMVVRGSAWRHIAAESTSAHRGWASANDDNAGRDDYRGFRVSCTGNLDR